MDEKKKIRKKTLIDHMFHLQTFHQLTHIDHLDVSIKLYDSLWNHETQVYLHQETLLYLSIHTARKKSDTSTGRLEPLVPAAAAGTGWPSI